MIDGNSKLVWVLEDDAGCQFVHEQTLGETYLLKFFKSISEFSQALSEATSRPDLIVADLNLEDGNFMSFLNSDKADSLLSMPFIIVSSIDDVEALRFCFSEGALDYLTKPFKKNELLIKVENILNKEKKPVASKGNKKEVSIDGAVISNLTSKQQQLLSLFMEKPDRMISRDDILVHVWGNTSVHPKTVDVHMYNLRRKIHEYGYIIRSEGGGKWSLLHERV